MRRPAVSIKARAIEFESLLAPEGNCAVLKTKTDDKHGWLAAVWHNDFASVFG